MEHKPYNGWYNYETWAVKLWLDNDHGTYQYMTSEAAGKLAEHTSDDGATDDDAFKIAFADFLKDHHQEAADDFIGERTSVFSDLLGAALSEVNWYEIAGAYLDDAKEAAE
jgi:hypothetical protein